MILCIKKSTFQWIDSLFHMAEILWFLGTNFSAVPPKLALSSLIISTDMLSILIPFNGGHPAHLTGYFLWAAWKSSQYFCFVWAYTNLISLNPRQYIFFFSNALIMNLWLIIQKSVFVVNTKKYFFWFIV